MANSIQHNFQQIPVRIALTDHCNLRCVFCSNEGMGKVKGTRSLPLLTALKLIKLLHQNGFKLISLTGGEPTVYPDIDELLTRLQGSPDVKVAFHTNGIELTPRRCSLIAGLSSKLAVSIHSASSKTWSTLTKGPQAFHKQILSNLNFFNLVRQGNAFELKLVPFAGHNDSVAEFRDFLNLANSVNATFKVLNLEAVDLSALRKRLPFQKVLRLMREAGAVPQPSTTSFRGQDRYLPFNRFNFKKTKGVVIDIGCGKKRACLPCWECNEIFIDPDLNIKPCHMTHYLIPLADCVKENAPKVLLRNILNSRAYLKTMPGLNKRCWTH